MGTMNFIEFREILRRKGSVVSAPEANGAAPSEAPVNSNATNLISGTSVKFGDFLTETPHNRQQVLNCAAGVGVRCIGICPTTAAAQPKLLVILIEVQMPPPGLAVGLQYRPAETKM